MVIYLAGPLTGRDGYTWEQNVDAALRIYRRLVMYERWMEYDFNLIDICSHLLMLPRWETSPGACREHQYAERLGKVIVYRVEDLYAQDVHGRRE